MPCTYLAVLRICLEIVWALSIDARTRYTTLLMPLWAREFVSRSTSLHALHQQLRLCFILTSRVSKGLETLSLLRAQVRASSAAMSRNCSTPCSRSSGTSATKRRKPDMRVNQEPEFSFRVSARQSTRQASGEIRERSAGNELSNIRGPRCLISTVSSASKKLSSTFLPVEQLLGEVRMQLPTSGGDLRCRKLQIVA